MIIEEFVVEDTELNEMLAVVAQEAYSAVIEAYQDTFGEDGEDVLDEEFDLYLYVYETGAWVIDWPEYLQDHRNIVAHAMVGPYVNADTLRYELEDSTF